MFLAPALLLHLSSVETARMPGTGCLGPRASRASPAPALPLPRSPADLTLELHQLRYFEAVARHLHFTRAADELHVAQPSVSQQLAKLEAELGTNLFHRMKRRVALTPAGEAF